MLKQPAFPGLRDATKRKLTRRERLLAEMDAGVPWERLLALIEPHDPKVGPKGGRPPVPLERMLRVCFRRNRYALSDPVAEETLHDSEAMRRFAGPERGDERIPDATTILNFRHLLERHGLTEAIFAEMNAHLADKGISLRPGTLVDATIIDAPASTKNRARDPEMSSTKTGNDWLLGMKAQVGVDVDSGTEHSCETSTAKVHDSQVWDGLLHGEEASVWADKGYVSAEREAAFTGPSQGSDQFCGVMRKAPRGSPPHPVDARINRVIAMVTGQGSNTPSGLSAPVRPCEDPLPRTGQEPRPALHPVGARQPVPPPTTAAGMTTSPPEIQPTAAAVQKQRRGGCLKKPGLAPTLSPQPPQSQWR